MRPLRTLIRRHVRLVAVVALTPLVVANMLVPSHPADLPTGPADTATVDRWLEGQLSDAGIPGGSLVIVRDGRIVDERGFGTADPSGRPVTATTPFVIGSLSKSITALAVMQLVDAGEVALDSPVRRYLPEFRVADPAVSDRITVRDLLTHTSGLSTPVGIAPLTTAPTSLDARVRDLATAELVSEPGTRYAYSNANYLVLGRLVEVVSGEPFGAYVQAHVFNPLGMAHAATDRATADAAGLTDAHRLWFGLADDHAPLDRPDLVPAGWMTASADDLGRLLIAELDGGRYEGRSVVSPTAVREMQTGIVSTGSGDERMGMGWVASTLDGDRIVAHAGSTTDMAAIQVLVPDRHLGVAVLFNAQSTLYELLHKPDAIGQGVVSLLLGHEPRGTLQLFYPAFDLAVLAMLGLLVIGLVRTVRRPVGRWPAWKDRPRLSRLRLVGSVGFRTYLDVVVPIVLLVKTPDLLGAPWTTLVRIDLGLVIAAIVAVRVADGAVRLARLAVARRGIARSGARPASMLPGVLPALPTER
jgi:CubicO group peptidase (beta-lactamase class C family)